MPHDRTPIPQLIARKRDGGSLSSAELSGLLVRYTANEMDDAQMSAFLMAGAIRGFSREEAVVLTEALLASGDRIDLSELRGPTVDKHSTGGVGDTTTLIVAPLLAAAGCQVAKLSGRGLGHTGGTIDKLETIPGFRSDLPADVIHRQVERIGIAVAAATSNLVPADKRLYALRDVTATVAAPALIASSVMSKKLAGGASTIMLDVKAGDGAFSPTVEDAAALAELCVAIGDAHGRRTGALVTDMSQPLGDAIGNVLEVAAAVDVLRGEGSEPLREVSLALAAGTLELLGRPALEAREEVTDLLDGGQALEVLGDLIEAQGGDTSVLADPRTSLPGAPVVRDWAPPEGFIVHIACRSLGEIVGALGGGRERAGDTIDPTVGLEINARIGDVIDRAGHHRGRPAVRIHAADPASADLAAAALARAIRTGSSAVPTVALVHRRIGLDGPLG